MRVARRWQGLLALTLTLGTLGASAVVARALDVPAPSANVSAGCSWLGETDQRDVNIGAPDLDAFYWLSPLTPNPNTRVAITGSYPHARYFSFHVYDQQGNALGSIYDKQIMPDRGSANPYRGPVPQGRGDSFTVYVVYAAKPKRPAPNTVYVDPSSAGDAGLLVYRIYVPSHVETPNGDVPYPQVGLQSSDGSQLSTLGACATTPPAFGSVAWQEFAALDYPSSAPSTQDSSATKIPTWQRSFGNMLGNQQNAYLVTDLSRQYGDLVVLHTRAPTFPNTRSGQPVYRRSQLRYWSLCTYDASEQAAVGCAADYAAAIRGGSITYVISDPGTRPPNATASRGVTWLPWGAQPAAQLVYRNMLPASWYRFAAQRVKTSTTSVTRALGPYYPRAVYCQPQTFERGGWRACFAAAGVRP